MTTDLKAPFPWFGGKSRCADLVWSRFGKVDNYIEPFCGSAAVLLARPDPPRIETVNDLDCMVANFWRATQADPDTVAFYADHPVNECDLHSRHRWLVQSEAAKAFREQMRKDPNYCSPLFAGWWCWGLCCWIGSGWCDTKESSEWKQAPNTDSRGVPSTPRESVSQQIPYIAGTGGGNGIDAVSSPSKKRPSMHRGNGVDTVPSESLSQQLPHVGNPGRGVDTPPREGRPQLADAYSRGRGVHGNDSAGICATRRQWLLDWFGRLRDRLRTVRVCCGHWLRVCDSPSTTTRLGLTGIFLDPPYSDTAGRQANLYASDSLTVAHEVRTWCLERGTDRQMRIALAGYEGEHNELEEHGWRKETWKANGGYGNQSAKGKENAVKERIWFSPHCLFERSLLDYIESVSLEPALTP